MPHRKPKNHGNKIKRLMVNNQLKLKEENNLEPVSPLMCPIMKSIVGSNKIKLRI